jgi:two-component system sensor histidine kinase YesM
VSPIRSIRTKLFLSLAAIFAIAMGLITFWWYWKSTQIITKSVKNYSHELIKEANDNFELTLKDIDYLSTVISLNKSDVAQALSNQAGTMNYEQLLMDRKLDDFISSLYGYKYYISSILIVGANGKKYSQGTTLSTDEVIREPWYRELAENKTARIFIKTHSTRSANQAALFPSQNVISVARGIFDDHQFLGVVLIDFRYDIIQKIFSTKIPHESSLFVIDQNGDFVYHPDNRFLGRNIRKTVYNKLLPMIQNSEGSFSFWVKKNETFVVYYKSDYTHWTTIGMISQKSMMREFVKTTNQTLYVSLFALFLVLIAANIIALTMTRNIFRLRDAMKYVGQGKFDTKVVIRTGDEIEELSRGFNTMVGEIQQLLQDVKNNERQKRLAELKAYQAQINPHFLSNTLNTVRWLAQGQKAINIESLVTSLIELLQVSMADADFISIRQELEYLKDYLTIQEYRYCDKFKVQYEIEPAILGMMTPKFILQPIVENALIHGIAPLDHQGLIAIKGYQDGENIIITVRDNGVGITTDKMAGIFQQDQNKDRQRFSSIGIYNVNERLKMNFGEDYGLKIESIPGVFTTVTITLPVRENSGEGGDGDV